MQIYFPLFYARKFFACDIASDILGDCKQEKNASQAKDEIKSNK